MIIIRVNAQIKPEERENFVAYLQQEKVDVFKKFAGCERFDLYKDLTDPNAFLLYEEWQTLDHFDAYRHSDFFKKNGEKLFPMMAGTPDSSYYQGTAVPV